MILRPSRSRLPAPLWIAAALLAGLLLLWAAGAGARAAGPTRVYGLELEKRGRSDRLLIFAEDALAPRLEAPDPQTLVLVLPGASLDPSAPTRISPKVAKGVSEVLAFEPADAAGPEVRVVIRRARNVEASLSQRGSIVALELARPPGAPIHLDFREAEIAEIVRDVGELTGARFLFDEKLRGRVSIAGADELDAEAALEVLGAALLLEGFALVPTPGGPLRIVPVELTPATAPWRPGGFGDDEATVTTIVHLEAADPDAVVAALQPRVAGGGLALAYPPSHSVILAGSEPAVARWIRLARALDAAAHRELRVVRLRHGTARKVARLVAELAEPEPGARDDALDVWPDARSNAVILRGTPARLDQARAWIERFDRPDAGEGRLQVVRLHHADPERLAALAAALRSPGVEGAAARLAGRPFRIAVDRPTRSLIIGGDAETRSLLEAWVRALDRPPPLVGVEILVMEVSLSDSLELGLDAFLPFTTPDEPGASTGAITLNPSGGGLLDPSSGARNLIARATREPLRIPIVDPSGRPTTFLVPRGSVVVNADGREIRSRLLSRPQLLMTSGDEHTLFAGDNIPLPVVRSAAEPGNAFATASDVERRDVGVELRVRPSTGQRGGVRLALRLDISRVTPALAGDVAQVGVSLRQRRLETTLQLEDGQVAVIGLPEETSVQRRVTGTPFLMDLPVLGPLFQNVREERMENHLLITARAWIERDGSAPARATLHP